jgi:hypothetical protein
MGIDWEYEKEGYDLGEFGYYLPDFWLPQVSMWAEVKPRVFTPLEYSKIKALAKGTKHSVLQLVGMPDFLTYEATDDADYLFEDGHSYFIMEHRFYSYTEFQGMPIDEMRIAVRETYGVFLADAINAARSARFEYGESG